MWQVLVCVLMIGSAMTFEQYLATRRPAPFRLIKPARNPYADTVAVELGDHLNTVRSWLNGSVNTAKMRKAMEFFGHAFPGQYSATPGAMVYRGQNTREVDGTPRSYSYEAWIADSFACEPEAGPFAKWFSTHPKSYVIERKVCHNCADKEAFKLTLDLGKLLSDYGLGKHKFSVESEVVILNTLPKGQHAQMIEITCDREDS